MARPMDDYGTRPFKGVAFIEKAAAIFPVSSGTNFHPTKVKENRKRTTRYTTFDTSYRDIYIHLQEVEPDPGELDINEKGSIRSGRTQI
jgi:hypothetical protein